MQSSRCELRSIRPRTLRTPSLLLRDQPEILLGRIFSSKTNWKFSFSGPVARPATDSERGVWSSVGRSDVGSLLESSENVCIASSFYRGKRSPSCDRLAFNCSRLASVAELLLLLFASLVAASLLPFNQNHHGSFPLYLTTSVSRIPPGFLFKLLGW